MRPMDQKVLNEKEQEAIACDVGHHKNRNPHTKGRLNEKGEED